MPSAPRPRQKLKPKAALAKSSARSRPPRSSRLDAPIGSMIAAIANTFANCFKILELKSRILFTLMVLGICRVTAMIPIPGLNGAALSEYFEKHAAKDSGAGGVLTMWSMFTGGALERCAVGALGIMPYISATIIIQLLSAVVPKLSKLDRKSVV